jgi:hypothetical protein
LGLPHSLARTTEGEHRVRVLRQKPLGPLRGCTQANLEDVVRLLRNPMGTIPIHRIHGPLSGQEEPVRILAERLERQLADKRKARDQDGPANGSQPIRSGANQTSPAVGALR